MTIEQLGSSDVVLDSLAKYLSRKPCEVKVNSLHIIGNDILDFA